MTRALVMVRVRRATSSTTLDAINNLAEPIKLVSELLDLDSFGAQRQRAVRRKRLIHAWRVEEDGVGCASFVLQLVVDLYANPFSVRSLLRIGGLRPSGRVKARLPPRPEALLPSMSKPCKITGQTRLRGRNIALCRVDVEDATGPALDDR